jgi:hypothetical protein
VSRKTTVNAHARWNEHTTCKAQQAADPHKMYKARSITSHVELYPEQSLRTVCTLLHSMRDGQSRNDVLCTWLQWGLNWTACRCSKSPFDVTIGCLRKLSARAECHPRPINRSELVSSRTRRSRGFCDVRHCRMPWSLSRESTHCL